MDLAAPIHSRVMLGSLTTLSVFLLLALGSSVAAHSAAPTLLSAAAPDSAVSKKEARAAYGKLPLAFVPNAGQTDARVRYSAQAGGASFYFTQKEAVFSFAGKEKGLALRLGFIGANPDVAIGARKRGAGKVNYLIGSDPATWRTNLPTYGQVVYHDLWPGIDMVFRGTGRQLKYEFHVAPGARVSDIRLAYRGASGLSLGRGGALRIQTARGVLTDTAPRSYQLAGGGRVAVASNYVLQGRRGYGFALGSGYDPARPLVVDPGLVYSTYLGGSADDQGFGIAVDAAGSAYVTGQTSSMDFDFPTTTGAFDTTYNGGVRDAFVTKLNPAGSAPLIYSTYLGGSGQDASLGIAVDAAGSAYVTGSTNSPDFPTTSGAFDTTHNGSLDAFVTKLNPAGSAPLLYSTYLGTSQIDQAFGIDVDAMGSAYVTGQTGSFGFPTTTGAFDTIYNGGGDVFVTKLNPSLAGPASLLYSTFLGGSSIEISNFGDVAVDAMGNAYVTGHTDSGNFPTTMGAFDTTFNGDTDAFVTKLNPSLAGPASLLYSTFLGGGLHDQAYGIAVDAVGSAYVTGETSSTNFPTTAGAFDTSLNGFRDVFVTKLNPSLAGPASLLYSTYLGGTFGFHIGRGIAVDTTGSAYVTGLTSANFPTTAGAFDTVFGGSFDAFVTKLDLIPAFVPATLTLDPPAAMNTVGTSHTVTATVRDAGGNPLPDIVVRFNVMGSVNTTGECTTEENGQCDFTYDGPPLPGADAITAFADTNDDGDQDIGEPAGAAEKTWVLPTSTELCEVKITQGGWIIAMNGDRASFGGNARVEEDETVKGEQNYQDHGPAQPRRVKSIELTAMTCSDDLTEGTIFGRATVDGADDVVFRIDVTDQGQDDTYGIIMDDGYVSGQQQLGGGNVQIHKN